MPRQRPTQPTSGSKPRNPISIPGEKTVRKTDQTAPIRPPRTPPDREPHPEGPAVDRRTQFSGSDEVEDDCKD